MSIVLDREFSILIEQGPEAAREYLMNLAPDAVERGGPGSGHFGHEGRPGEVGGSLPSSNRSADDRLMDALRASADKVLTVEDVPPNSEDQLFRGWLMPNGEMASTRGTQHTRTAEEALMEAGIPIDNGILGVPEPVNTMIRRNFARLIVNPNSLNYDGPQHLTPEQAEFIAKILDARPFKDVFADFPEGELAIWVIEGSEARRILSDMIDEAYRLIGRSYTPIWRGGPGSGFHGHAGRPGEVGGSVPEGGRATESRDRGPYWHQDNPLVSGFEGAEEWLRTHPDTVTAWYDSAPIDPATLTHLPGARGEEAKIDEQLIDKLAQSMREQGYLENQAPLIIVEADGGVHVWEGNHRIRAAAKAGLPSIPVDVRYMGGAELLKGVWEPKIVDGGATERSAPQRDDIITRALLGLDDAFERLSRLLASDSAAPPIAERGGPGSGHFGHEGRPGKVGGSQPDDGASSRSPYDGWPVSDLMKIEEEIADKSYESVFVVGRDGVKFDKTDYNGNSVMLEDAISRELVKAHENGEDIMLVHNHPAGSPFSFEDVEYGFGVLADELVVVSEKVRYRLKIEISGMVPNDWYGEPVEGGGRTGGILNDLYSHYEAENRRLVVNADPSERTSEFFAEAYKRAMDDTWRYLAETHPDNFQYFREIR